MMINFDYLLSQVSFDKQGRPFIELEKGDDFIVKNIVFGSSITMKFDTTRRFCIGSFSLEGGNPQVCPDHAEVGNKYEQCKKCMDKTGFNPAFYYSDKTSSQQTEYNKQPHSLYLAYFANNYIKVGISRDRRVLTRLLEQGALAAIILGVFDSAIIARQYEARISSLDGIRETVPLNKKYELLSKNPFDYLVAKDKLQSVSKMVQSELLVKFENEVLDLSKYYGDLSGILDMTDMGERGLISGRVVAMVGSVLVVLNGDNYLALPLKKFVGYRCDCSENFETIPLPPKQVGLF